MKKNCWEFKSCGREPGGKSTKELGVCPATTDKRLHGIHDGRNAGRACWVIAGTMCGGKIQGTFAQKYENCGSCDFYQTVRAEERGNHKLSITLINHLKNAE
ncbi:MAG TPA: hypothetical protein VN328_08335 [Thermodesulfovibrionales bacterium]|nr:hypothetical protein [Thermodesulfovibrionales bacterium]